MRDETVSSAFRRILATGMAIAVMVCCCGPLPRAEGKKGGGKGGGASEAELKKNLEPLMKSLDGLLLKVQSRYLFSPKDSGQLSGIKYQLLDMMETSPKSPLLTKPVYQAGILYARREMFMDAYELFLFLTVNFPETPYGMRAKTEIELMKKQLGEHYFPEPAVTAPNGIPAPADAPKAKNG